MEKKNRFTFLFMLIAYAIILYIGIYVVPGSKYIESLRAGFKITIPKLLLYGLVFYGICGVLVAFMHKTFSFKNDGNILIILTTINILSIIITTAFTQTAAATIIIPYLKWFYGMYFINFGLLFNVLYDKADKTVLR